METVTAMLRSDKRSKPEMNKYERLTYEQAMHICSGDHLKILDQQGKVAQVRVTSVKTWKTRPEFEVHCKFGLYEFFTIMVKPGDVTDFVQLVK